MNQNCKKKMPEKEHAWFDEARFGMFIHWGAYAVAGRGEWVANRERIPQAEYTRRYVEPFQAELYDPDAWVALARDAGMGYVVLTVRHHDGFSLWPTRADDFHAGNLGPKRDLVGPYVEACRRAGLKVGLYYSPANWFHPDYPGAFFRDWPGREDWVSIEARERMIAYYRAQLRELMTGYGRIDYLWFDGCLPDDLRSSEANEEMLLLQPHLLINERNGAPCHVKVSEQAIRPARPGELWEACMTLNDNWGYHAGDRNWKSSRQVVQMLVETASKAGNLLLNIGPKADGTIPDESIRILHETGAWMLRNGEAIRGSSRSPFTWANWGKVTTRGNRVYLHVWNSPGSELCFSELKNRVQSVGFPGGGKLDFIQSGDYLTVRGLPTPLPDPLSTTLVIEVEGEPDVITPQTTFWIPGEPAS